jgi:hypothetical protein
MHWTIGRIFSPARGASAGAMTLGVATMALMTGSFADALGATSVASCVAAKMKASGQRVLDEAKCHRKALLVAAAVEPGCLARADTRFAGALARAELGGPCPGSAWELDAIVGSCVDSIVTSGSTTTTTSSSTSTTVVPGPGTCCQGASLCMQVDVDCSVFGAEPGAPGTVCDGTSGACAVPPVAGGPCCHVDGLFCLAGPTLNATTCTSLTGSFSPTAQCTPTGCTP